MKISQKNEIIKILLNIIDQMTLKNINQVDWRNGPNTLYKCHLSDLRNTMNILYREVFFDGKKYNEYFLPHGINSFDWASPSSWLIRCLPAFHLSAPQKSLLGLTPCVRGDHKLQTVFCYFTQQSILFLTRNLSLIKN